MSRELGALLDRRDRIAMDAAVLSEQVRTLQERLLALESSLAMPETPDSELEVADEVLDQLVEARRQHLAALVELGRLERASTALENRLRIGVPRAAG